MTFLSDKVAANYKLLKLHQYSVVESLLSDEDLPPTDFHVLQRRVTFNND